MEVVAVRMGLAFEYLSHNHSGKATGNLFTFLNSVHLDAYRGPRFRDLGGSKVTLQIVL